MGKVRFKLKWQNDAPCVTLRVSGRWDEVIQSLHSAAMEIKAQAEYKYGGAGVRGMNRPRAATQRVPVMDEEE